MKKTVKKALTAISVVAAAVILGTAPIAIDTDAGSTTNSASGPVAQLTDMTWGH
ncbi:hypothetical protein ACIPSA_47350 [Streptomyces sp. NPDC086549]|uniref:hypothetical protein n=1 Tax=Streptomyces sp. NPDC086549 TaxID=3365752 RepID=UPI0037F6239D